MSTMDISRDRIIAAAFLLSFFVVSTVGIDGAGSGVGPTRRLRNLQWTNRDGAISSLALSLSARPAFDPLATRTNRPVIGILTLPVDVAEEKVFGAQTFATSYVRFIQAGGARVAPIFYDSTEAELAQILNKVNGVLWTGSMVEFNPSDNEPEGFKYHRATEYILRHVIRENQRGNYYPLWATCLGFERLMEILLQDDSDESVLEETDAIDYPINLDLTPDGLKSRMFQNISRALLQEVRRPDSNIIYNNHGLGVRPAALGKNLAVNSAFGILSTSKDRNGKEFISSIEGKYMPIYGTQWHPEKCAWEWNPRLHPSHSTPAIQLSNFFGRLIVQECKYNSNRFPDDEDEDAALIHNWFSYPAGNWSVFSEVYFFWSPHPDQRPSTPAAFAAREPLRRRHPLLLKLLKSILEEHEYQPSC